jgi:hypothetical protein
MKPLHERIICFTGRHDWHISQKERRWAGSWEDWWLPIWIFIVMPITSISLILSVHSIVNLEPGEFFLSMVGLGITAIFFWARSLINRMQHRIDAQCLYCGKQKLELSRRQASVRSATTFLESLKEISEEP